MGCSGYLVRSDNTSIVLDFGPGTLSELRRHQDFRSIDAIVISHWHLDHILDLPLLRHALHYNPVAATRRVPLYLPPGTRNALSRLGAAMSIDPGDDSFFEEAFVVDSFKPDGQLQCNELTLEFSPVRHFVPCWAMQVQADSGERLGYTSDTGPMHGLHNFFKGADLLIAEATDPETRKPEPETGHMTGAEAGQLAAEASVRQLMLTHIWEERGWETPLAAASSVFSGLIHVARPGISVTVGSDT
ncbi:MBL fold metallo-hydrolase [soil metagenome]